MVGWDDAFFGRDKNPYRRGDHRADYDAGHKKCSEDKLYPKWYGEWRDLGGRQA